MDGLKKVNLLVFPAGEETGMNICDSLRYSRHFNVFGASGRLDHAEFIYPADKYYQGDLYVSDDHFIDNFNGVLKRFDIDYVIPIHEIIAMHLMKMKDRIHAGIICSPYETARIAADKKLTWQVLKDAPFYPEIFEKPDEVTKYPVFLKPYISLGSRDVHLARDRDELEHILARNPDLMICEYLRGREYTVDCFTNRNGELLFAGARVRSRIKAGRSFRAERAEDNSGFEEIARELNDRLQLRGAWFFQVKEDDAGMLKFMEFGVIQAGTADFFTPLGVNFTALSVFDAMGHDVKVLFNDCRMLLDVRFQNSYRIDYDYERVYLDFEDVLVVGGKVNTTMMKLLYQWVDAGIKIILLVEECGDFDKILLKHRISRELFDIVVPIRSGEKKAGYIERAKAIFIGSRFAERLLVKEECGIPVFDADAAECLIDFSVI